MALPKLTLILGGAASGKSAFAEHLVLQGGNGTPIYIATAQIFDDEMADKVAKHREMRGTGWHTIEEPVDFTGVLAQVAKGQPVLIDCATLWLTNLILGEHDVVARTDALITALAHCNGPVMIVSNEVGQGIVPDNALSRRFRNAQGRLNQRLAAQADLVVAVMAGLPLTLKGSLA
ncbi:adenosylcobinamide kinase /adenosylcobinamide-phosphate guanylyltransferase [Yoonia maricola]|uniref:Bifunctional adenosylcobalamin biosynthesis protein n=1 Tax=Yoonia maricola TaxID=420999 RepID=A0A2M8W2Y0_9RHOB|nr:bifunctional adenosylcobinamide kinase/adenosylcobinamide-phosphate guanylyltransferase [Yoonia maricola]PJI85302.1 adenosylcobinamide kinase /adenosylcobinamide-phosphate guanylyltransferase [Yoonia maricola]